MTEQTDESAAFIDLDAALAERTEEPVRVKHNGTTYDLPPVLSAEAMLAALRLDTDADRGTLTEINMRLVLTDEVFDSLVADGIGWKDLVSMTGRLTRYYLIGAENDANEGESDPSP